MTENPETHRIIYLEPEVCADPSTGPLWCQDDYGSDHPETGEPVHWTAYILKSEYDAIQRERDEVADEIERLRRLHDIYHDALYRIAGGKNYADDPWDIARFALSTQTDP